MENKKSYSTSNNVKQNPIFSPLRVVCPLNLIIPLLIVTKIDDQKSYHFHVLTTLVVKKKTKVVRHFLQLARNNHFPVVKTIQNPQQRLETNI